LADKPVKSVFIGEFTTGSGECTLAVHGLGSCAAVILFDPTRGLAGLAHVLLPGRRPAGDRSEELPAKFGEDALEALQKGLAELGASRENLKAALLGGAHLFQSEMDVDRGVGHRNTDALRTSLEEKGIPLLADETGGNQGRTVFFDLPECVLKIRTLRSGWHEISLGTPTSGKP
jgi:chemotaxis protein CheD